MVLILNLRTMESVDFAVTLAAMNSDSHIQKIIMALSELFQNDNDIDAIISAKTVEEITQISKKY